MVRMLRARDTIVLVSALALALLCAAPGPAAAISVGDRAPDFSLADADGSTHTLAGDAGKVRLLYFFGHSAQVCGESAGYLESDLQGTYGPKGLVILGLECWDGTAQQIRDFSSAHGVSYPLLANAGDTARQYDLPYHSFVVIDTGGIVRLVLQGPDAAAYDRDRIEQTVKSLLQDPSAAEEQTWGAIKALFRR